MTISKNHCHKSFKMRKKRKTEFDSRGKKRDFFHCEVSEVFESIMEVR